MFGRISWLWLVAGLLLGAVFGSRIKSVVPLPSA